MLTKKQSHKFFCSVFLMTAKQNIRDSLVTDEGIDQNYCLTWVKVEDI